MHESGTQHPRRSSVPGLAAPLVTSALGLGLLLLAGCQSGPSTYPVSGTVTFDGTPIAEGEIIFASDDGALGPDAGRIVNGTFAFRAKAGKKKVRIFASRKVPGKGAMGEDFVYQSFVPAWYNDKTTLVAEVSAATPNQYDFPLRARQASSKP